MIFVLESRSRCSQLEALDSPELSIGKFLDYVLCLSTETDQGFTTNTVISFSHNQAFARVLAVQGRFLHGQEKTKVERK